MLLEMVVLTLVIPVRYTTSDMLPLPALLFAIAALVSISWLLWFPTPLVADMRMRVAG